MRAQLFLLVILLGASTTAIAGDGPSIDGGFAFDVTRPEKSRCSKVAGKLKAKLQASFTCTTPDAPESSASGKRIVASCAAKKGRSEFLVLATKADCDEERATQLANE